VARPIVGTIVIGGNEVAWLRVASEEDAGRVQCVVSKQSLSIGVRAAGMPGCEQLAGDLHWAPTAASQSSSGRVVVFCFPGGGMSRHYFDLAVEGYSMATHLASFGFLVVTVDHPGVGGSDVPDDPWELTPARVADVDALAVRQVLGRLSSEGLPGVPAKDPVFVIGVGHSAGALLVIHQQARHQVFDAVSLLGWAGHGLPQHLDEHERHLADGAPLTEETLVAAARRRHEEARVDLPRGSSSWLVANEMPEQVHAALVDARSPLLSVVGLASMIPGGTAGPAAEIKVPVFLGVGENDIATDPLRVPTEFPGSPDVTLYVLAQAGHNHNVEPNRGDLWDRMTDWISSITPKPDPSTS
jgi:pimeloyl-ACP methyl ester carboxylesterase